MSDLKEYITDMARAAKKASVGLRTLNADAKNAALKAIAESIDARRAEIRAANAKDVERGTKAGLSSAMVDRLTLTDTHPAHLHPR